MSMEFTIEVTDETMIMREGKSHKSRPVWRADGIVFHVKGALTGKKYEQAANLAMNFCEGVHIPAGRLRAYEEPRNRNIKQSDTLARRMRGF